MKEIDELELSDTPNIASLTKLIGADLLTQLSEDLGGMAISISRNPGQHSPLAVSIGLDAARKIGHVYGGMTFEVPLRAGKEAKILKMHSEKVPINQICHKLGVSRWKVYNTLRFESARVAHQKQRDLFLPRG